MGRVLCPLLCNYIANIRRIGNKKALYSAYYSAYIGFIIVCYNIHYSDANA